MYTNAQILSAVLNKWAQPFIKTLIQDKVRSMGILGNFENKIRSMGWVSPQWSLLNDLSPIMDNITGSIVTPMLNRYISQMDDASIPKMAHDIVDGALNQGGLKLMDGMIELELEDLEELKKLLEFNLPVKSEDVYEVKTS